MNERGMARFVGLYTLLLGATFAALPRWTSRFFGMGDRPWLMRYLGVRDLALAAGLLAPQRPRPWLLVRGVADASDVGLMAAGLVSRRYSPRALPLLAAALGSAALSLALSQRVEDE